MKKKEVYMSCVRAIDFLTSQPDWDGKKCNSSGR